MIAIVHSIYSQSVHAPALDAGLMDNDAERYCIINYTYKHKCFCIIVTVHLHYILMDSPSLLPLFPLPLHPTSPPSSSFPFPLSSYTHPLFSTIPHPFPLSPIQQPHPTTNPPPPHTFYPIPSPIPPLPSYAFKMYHFLYKHNDIVSVDGSSIVLYIECLGGMFLGENL